MWGLLVFWSLWRTPIPSVNEPHYWGKAKSWWDPTWCAGDLFLTSANPHLIFYATFGSLTQWFSLPEAALIGRVIGLLILAVGWQRFCQSLIGTRWSGLWAMGVFLFLQSIGNFSGEWLVGGMESKVPSYGFLFWSIGELLRRKWNAAGLFAGLSVTFHPLIGLWGSICILLAIAAQLIAHRFNPGKSQSEQADEEAEREDEEGPEKGLTIKAAVVAIVCGVFTSLPGLIPALGTLNQGTPDENRIANYLQVADRLAHHLDPMVFPKSAYWYAGSLLVICLLLWKDIRATGRQQWWRWFVGISVVIAIVGIAIGLGPRPLDQMPGFNWRSGLLKFYPFRLGDLMIPVAVSIATIEALQSWNQSNLHKKVTRWLTIIFAALIFLGAFLIPFPNQNPSRFTGAERQNWIDAGEWIKQNTPNGSLIYATDGSWGLRWLTHRPEYVNYKDIPQDATSIVEWNQRLWKISRWRKAAFEDGEVTADELAELKKQTGIQYLFTGRFGPVKFTPVYENSDFHIYELP